MMSNTPAHNSLFSAFSPQDTVSETANQRTWKAEESEFFYGLRTSDLQVGAGVGEEWGRVGVGRPIAHSRKLEGEQVVQFQFLLSPV